MIEESRFDSWQVKKILLVCRVS